MQFFYINVCEIEIIVVGLQKQLKMKDMEKVKEEAPWGIEALRGKGKGYDWGEGMMLYGNGREEILVNTETKEVWTMVDENGHLVGFTKDDVDWEAIRKLEHSGSAYTMTADYGGIGRMSDFYNGKCTLCWTLYPDGRYFADEDGYGMEDNEEVVVYAVIDKHMHVLSPFR